MYYYFMETTCIIYSIAYKLVQNTFKLVVYKVGMCPERRTSLSPTIA